MEENIPLSPPDEEREKRVIKTVVCGAAGVGKSSILNRLHHNEFKSQMESTIGVAFVIHTLKTQDSEWIKYQIWDTSGQERFKGVIFKTYVANAKIFIFVFDLCNRYTYEEIPSWLVESGWGNNPKIIGYLIANKSDMNCHRQVSRDEAEHFALDHKLHYVELSAKTGDNVQSAFLQITDHVNALEKVVQFESKGSESIFFSNPTSITGVNEPKKHKKKSCKCFPRRKQHIII